MSYVLDTVHSSKSKPLVTVIVACFNAQDFIEDAIISLLNQSYKNIEIIIVDDCSSDSSVLIIENYLEKHDRVTLIRLHKNMGPAAARNAAIKIAKGKWIAIQDADDISFPHRIERLVDKAESEDNVVLIGSSAKLIRFGSRHVKNYRYAKTNKKLKRNLLESKKFPPHSSIMYRASAVRAAGTFNERFKRCQDWDLYLKLTILGDFKCLREQLVAIRLHDNNISNTSLGSLSVVYASCASVCHHLRSNGYEDPSSHSELRRWDEFFEWMSVNNKDYELRRTRIFQIKNTRTKSYFHKVLKLSWLAFEVAKFRWSERASSSNCFTKRIERVALEWVAYTNEK